MDETDHDGLTTDLLVHIPDETHVDLETSHDSPAS
jgi:hypothetical protein